MPLGQFLKYFFIELVLFIIWIKILDFQIIPDITPKKTKKKNIIKLREPEDNYPFDKGNSVDWYEY